jgi:hypothetical protein
MAESRCSRHRLALFRPTLSVRGQILLQKSLLPMGGQPVR